MLLILPFHFICTNLFGVYQMRLSHSQEPVDIAQYLQNLFDGPEERWPYVDTSNFMGDVLFADQPKIDLQVCILSIFLYSYFIFKIFCFVFEENLYN